MEHVCSLLGVLQKRQPLEQAGFVLEYAQARMQGMRARPDEPELCTEDDFAYVLGQLVCHVVAERLKRGLVVNVL